MKRSWLVPTIILVVLLCCLGLFALGAGGGIFYLLNASSERTGESFVFSSPTPTPVVIRPKPLATSESGSQKKMEIIVSDDTLTALENTIVPTNDLPDLARRLEGKENIPTTTAPSSIPLTIGTKDSFWVINGDTNEKFHVSATLQYVTDHVYFWIQDEVSFDESDVKDLAETFESQIYPTNREFFGSEWSPGVDGDRHLYILYASELGRVAGYFSSADEYHPLAYEYSNAHEIFLLNADNLDLSNEYTYGVLAHEFQHMIHWYRDRNEQTWLNEGFSELASFLNGYDGGGFDFAYVRNPDIQLTDWPTDLSQTAPHYGSAFLFLTYFLDRFGDEATKALVGHPENGMLSVDEVLVELGARDSLQNRLIGADDVFLDWVLASFLSDESVADGRFSYRNYPNAPQPKPTETIRLCPQRDITRDVHQYGVDYIRIKCQGDYDLRFEGTIQVPVLPEDPYSGDYIFWSNQGDESDMTLTRTFDFTDHEGPLTLSYWTWYDIEEDYDYLYVEASVDGEDWQILMTPSGTGEDPIGNSYGWGYNGFSRGWIQESVNLSQYAGKEVQIRFEYVTDAAVNGEGFLLDDVSIPEIGYFSSFEDGDGGWSAQGWVRIQNVLPQTYRLALISLGKTTTVEYLSLASDNTVSVPINIGEEVDEVILVVTGTTRFTRQKAAYRFSLEP